MKNILGDTTSINRRKLLIASALSVGSLSLRSVITGLPLPFLAGLTQGVSAASTPAKFLILSHMQNGDPLNANAPGTYVNDPAQTSDPLAFVQHAKVSELGTMATGFETPSNFMLGNVSVKAAAPWASLPVDMREHMAFWHHGTYVNAHPEFATVRRLNGAVKGADGSGTTEFGSFIAEELSAELGTVSKEIIAVGGSRVQSNGRELSILSPANLKSIFVSSEANIDKMIALRSRFLDKTYQEIKTNGTPAQKKFLDNYALSRQEAAQVGGELGALLADVDGDDPLNQVRAAVALIQLNIAPVVTLGLPFGGDNHQDTDLDDEVTETTASIATLAFLWDRLKAAGLQDKVTFATLNTFGRSLVRSTSGGRNHNGLHHTMCVFGSSIKPGVVGGIAPTTSTGSIQEFRAASINSVTGGTSGATDVPYEQSLAAVGKTLAKAVGVSDAKIELRISTGKIISGALVS
jgi:hypothetical protein